MLNRRKTKGRHHVTPLQASVPKPKNYVEHKISVVHCAGILAGIIAFHGVTFTTGFLHNRCSITGYHPFPWVSLSPHPAVIPVSHP